MKIVVDHYGFTPTRAHETDAGLDLYAADTAIIDVGGSFLFDTGVHVELPVGYVGLVKSRSSCMKYGMLTDGVIDCGYTGAIKVKLFNHGDAPFIVDRGERIAQLVILPIITPELEIVESLEDTERGEGGFGSTGK